MVFTGVDVLLVCVAVFLAWSDRQLIRSQSKCIGFTDPRVFITSLSIHISCIRSVLLRSLRKSDFLYSDWRVGRGYGKPPFPTGYMSTTASASHHGLQESMYSELQVSCGSYAFHVLS